MSKQEVAGVFRPTGDPRQMKSLTARLKTFKTWPFHPSDFGQPGQCLMRPIDLAEAGFYYVGILDRVSCFACGGQIEEWEEGDEAIGEHRRLFPDCAFARRMEKERTQYRQSDDDDALVLAEDSTDCGGASVNSNGFWTNGTHRPDQHCQSRSKEVSRARELSGAKEERDTCTGSRSTCEASYVHWGDERTPETVCRTDITEHLKQNDMEERGQLQRNGTVSTILQNPTYRRLLGFGFDEQVVRGVIDDYLSDHESSRELPPFDEFLDRVLAAADKAVHQKSVTSTATGTKENARREEKRDSSTKSAEVMGYDEWTTRKSEIIDSQARKLAELELPNTTSHRRPGDAKIESPIQGSLPTDSSTAFATKPADYSTSTAADRAAVDSKMMCKICLDVESDTVFLPCGHAVACQNCAGAVEKANLRCPICRRRIKRVWRIYF